MHENLGTQYKMNTLVYIGLLLKHTFLSYLFLSLEDRLLF